MLINYNILYCHLILIFQLWLEDMDDIDSDFWQRYTKAVVHSGNQVSATESVRN